jgi:hypothetical protein
METPDTDTVPKKHYKVAIFSTLFVDAVDEQQAKDIAHDALIGCAIKARDFELDVENWED